MNKSADDQRHERIVRIPIHEKKQSNTPSSNSLEGNLVIPNGAEGIIVFAHGSGSSRHSPRNQYVARVLNDAGLATLLIDLLTREEEEIDLNTRQHRFNIELLSNVLLQLQIGLYKIPKYKIFMLDTLVQVQAPPQRWLLQHQNVVISLVPLYREVGALTYLVLRL